MNVKIVKMPPINTKNTTPVAQPISPSRLFSDMPYIDTCIASIDVNTFAIVNTIDDRIVKAVDFFIDVKLQITKRRTKGIDSTTRGKINIKRKFIMVFNY